MEEKRQHFRRKKIRSQTPLDHPVYWKYKNDENLGYICDISLSGCFISSRIIPGENAKVIIYLPYGEKYILLPGLVKPQQRKLSGFGVVFDDLTARKLTALALYVTQSSIPVSERRKR